MKINGELNHSIWFGKSSVLLSLKFEVFILLNWRIFAVHER